MKKLILLTIIIIALLKTESYSCTIVMVSDSKVTLAGSNEDSTFPLTIFWFVPASKNNNKEKSITEYKKILDINPNHSIAKQEIERLEMVKEK